MPQLPPTRQTKTLGDEKIIQIIDGDRGKNYPKKSEFTEEGYCLFLNTSNVRQGYRDLEKLEFIDQERDELLRKGKTQTGDIILTTRGTIGNCAYRDKKFPFEHVRINSGMVILRVNPEKLLPEFLLKILLSPKFIEQVNAKTSGSAQPQLPIRVMNTIDLPLPPLATQIKIVERLDEVSASITQSKQSLTQQLAQLDEIRNSSLSQIFDNSEREQVKMGDYRDIRDGTHDSPKYLEKGHPFITSKNLKENGIDLEDVKFISDKDFNKINERSKVDKGDLLFAMIGTIGNPTIVKEDPSFAIKNVALFKPKDLKAMIEYLKYFLRSKSTIDTMISESRGSTQKFVGLGYLRNFKLPLPPLDEQSRIVAHLDKLHQRITTLREHYTSQIQYFDELRASTLDQAFTGQLVRE